MKIQVAGSKIKKEMVEAAIKGRAEVQAQLEMWRTKLPALEQSEKEEEQRRTEREAKEEAKRKAEEAHKEEEEKKIAAQKEASHCDAEECETHTVTLDASNKAPESEETSSAESVTKQAAVKESIDHTAAQEVETETQIVFHPTEEAEANSQTAETADHGHTYEEMEQYDDISEEDEDTANGETLIFSLFKHILSIWNRLIKCSLHRYNSCV